MRDRSERKRLRGVFDGVAELYDRSRPGYPNELFDDLVQAASLVPGGRVVEIGPGTGQATRQLAELGLAVTAVELGGRLATVARRNLAAFPAVEVVEAELETWEPRARGFDAVVAFTAFHWLDPATRYSRAAALLRPGGALAIAHTAHVCPEGGDTFFAEAQEDYIATTDVIDPSPPPPPEEVAGLAAEIDAAGLFETVSSTRYLWDATYTAEQYVAVLGTYSGHLAWSEEVRRRLGERLRSRIAARPGGTIRKSYLTTLDVARTSDRLCA
jgi:SAM-dependent methyltransferase